MVIQWCWKSLLVNRIITSQHICIPLQNAIIKELPHSFSTKRTLSCKYLKKSNQVCLPSAVISYGFCTLIKRQYNSFSHGRSNNREEEKDRDVTLSNPGLIRIFGNTYTATEIIQHVLTKEEMRKVVEAKKRYIYLKNRGIHVPEHVTDELWLEMAILYNSEYAQKQLLRKYHVKEKTKSLKARTGLKTMDNGRSNDNINWEKRDSNFSKSILQVVSDQKIIKHGNSRLVQAMQFGIPLIIDFDFEVYMTYPEIQATANEIARLYSLNRKNKSPYHLIFCNTSKAKLLLDLVLKMMLNSTVEDLYCTVTEKHYLDLYNPNDLVYLTADTRKELTHFNPDSIYIIGGYTDTYYPKPRTITKALRENISTAKLPVKRFFRVKGNADLTVSKMMNVMLELKNTGNMEKAIIQNFPRSKIEGNNFKN